ncbi:MAG: hypothetical protein K2H41_11770 [Acetatifactor sp.]|nr:hypothetical protein [Acetatifactor sp.]
MHKLLTYSTKAIDTELERKRLRWEKLWQGNYEGQNFWDIINQRLDQRIEKQQYDRIIDSLRDFRLHYSSLADYYLQIDVDPYKAKENNLTAVLLMTFRKNPTTIDSWGLAVIKLANQRGIACYLNVIELPQSLLDDNRLDTSNLVLPIADKINAVLHERIDNRNIPAVHERGYHICDDGIGGALPAQGWDGGSQQF